MYSSKHKWMHIILVAPAVRTYLKRFQEENVAGISVLGLEEGEVMLGGVVMVGDVVVAKVVDEEQDQVLGAAKTVAVHPHGAQTHPQS